MAASKTGVVVLCFLIASLLLGSPSPAAAAEPAANTQDPGRKTMKPAAEAVAADQEYSGSGSSPQTGGLPKSYGPP
ncbi:hypothetical protein ACP4OV_001512 [Aristida adscensionis]